MMVRQSSIQSFFAFANNQDYLAGMGHRTAAVEDSRLLPLSQIEGPASAPPGRADQPGQ